MPDRDFAADLEALRLHAGLSLRELVKSTGIPRSTLSDALAGRRFPRLATALAVVRACGADPAPWRKRWAAIRQRESSHHAASATPEGPVALAGPAASARPAARSGPPASAVPAVPVQLPRDIAGFASREHEMARLDRGGIALVHGRPGVGKTSLAVHWAHSVSADYPDGQLFLNLRGHHPTLGPMSTVEAMGRLLGSLDVPWAPMTQDADEGVNLWRSSLARKRLLIVLDDAISTDQVRPLLPSAPGCTMLITSRHYLADLVVHDGAEGIVLDVLSPADSMALLRSVVGAARVEAEPEAAAAVAEACGHLPLALRLTGAVLAGAPDRGFAELLDDLAAGDRLSALEGLAKPSAVEDAFELSYRALPAVAKFLFRRLGLHPGPTASVQAAALLTGLEPAAVEAPLRMLAEAHLVEPGRSRRYHMHDLLRDYAARLADAADTGSEREAARQRLFGWYADRALGVSLRLDKGRERLWVDESLRSSWEPDDVEAAAWLEAEDRNIIAAIEYDARHGPGRYAWTFVDLVADLMFRRRGVTGLLVATDAGLEAAQRCGDRHAEGTMRLRRGWLRWRAGQKVGAAEDFERARTLFREAGARRAEAAALRGLSITDADAGRQDEARHHAEQALAIYREDGDRNGEAATLNSLAVVTIRAADFAASATFAEKSLALQREIGNRGYIALALANLSEVSRQRGNVEFSAACADEAIDLARQIGDAHVETIALVNSALALDQLGSPQETHRRATAAVARAGELGHCFAEAIALDALATASRRLGYGDVDGCRSLAITRAQEAGDLFTQAEILVGAARDAYEAAAASTRPADHVFAFARAAAQRALDAASAAGGPHCQAEALCLSAVCDLALGNVADALGEAEQAVKRHVTSGARLAEAAARGVHAQVLLRNGNRVAAEVEWQAAHGIVDRLAVSAAAPIRRLLDRPLASPAASLLA